MGHKEAVKKSQQTRLNSNYFPASKEIMINEIIIICMFISSIFQEFQKLLFHR